MAWELNDITGQVIDSALSIHKRLGPGLLESVYDTLLAKAIEQCGLTVIRHQTIAFEFRGIRFRRGLCPDMLVDHRVLVEVKSAARLAPIHSRQLLTYLRLMDLRIGLVINFGGATLKEGIKRVVNDYKGG